MKRPILRKTVDYVGLSMFFSVFFCVFLYLPRGFTWAQVHSFTQRLGLLWKLYHSLHVKDCTSFFVKPLFLLSFLTSPVPSLYTQTLIQPQSCPRVLCRLEPAPAVTKHSLISLWHVSALSFRSHASFFYCPIQTDSRDTSIFSFIFLLNILARHNGSTFFMV